MTKFLIYSALLLFGHSVLGQESLNEPEFFFNEGYISINRSTEANNIDSRIGFGFGIRGNTNKNGLVGLNIGLEYNKKIVFTKYYSASHFSHTRDATIGISCISLPLSLHINIGKKHRFYTDLGMFLEINTWNSVKATTTSYLPYQKRNISETKEKFNGGTFFIGPTAGLGFNIPFGNHIFTVRTEYKHSLTNTKGNSRGSYKDYNNSNLRVVTGISF